MAAMKECRLAKYPPRIVRMVTTKFRFGEGRVATLHSFAQGDASVGSWGAGIRLGRCTLCGPPEPRPMATV